MPGFITKKKKMTRMVSGTGSFIPCTVLEVVDSFVVQKREKKRDGYTAIQIGGGKKKEKNTSLPMQGHFKKASCTFLHKLVECRIEEKISKQYNVGDILFPEKLLQKGEKIKAIAVSKGKGMQGVMKRHNFSGGDSTHGQGSCKRAHGSIGNSSDSSRVWKGMKMAGRMGGDRITCNSVIFALNNRFIIIGGSVPGAVGDYVVIKKRYE